MLSKFKALYQSKRPLGEELLEPFPRQQRRNSTGAISSPTASTLDGNNFSDHFLVNDLDIRRELSLEPFPRQHRRNSTGAISSATPSTFDGQKFSSHFLVDDLDTRPEPFLEPFPRQRPRHSTGTRSQQRRGSTGTGPDVLEPFPRQQRRHSMGVSPGGTSERVNCIHNQSEDISSESQNNELFLQIQKDVKSGLIASARHDKAMEADMKADTKELLGKPEITEKKSSGPSAPVDISSQKKSE